MAVEHKSVPTLGGSIKKTRAHEAAAPMSGEAVVSEIMRAYRTIDALTAENARKNGVWTGVCGESAADPALIPLYLAMGITELSMSPAALPEARERVRSLDMEEARAALARALGEVE